jgi:hypothetical protein
MPVSKGRKKATRRPTPPSRPDPLKSKGPSPRWYVIVMATLMGAGLLLILLNYMGLVPGGDTDNKYLLTGLAGIGAGFAMTLNYR